MPKQDDARQTARYADMLAAMGTEPRLRILRLLLAAHPEGLVVGDIASELDIASSTLSHHLKKLMDVALVTQERQATTLICRANYPAMTALIGYLADECCADAACASDADVAAA